MPLERDIAHVRQPAGGNTGRRREVAVVFGIALRLDLEKLDAGWRLAEDIGPDEQVAMPDGCLEDSHVGQGEEFVGLPERFVVVERIYERAPRKIEACKCPDAVALVGQRLHRGIALPLVGILARLARVEELCRAGAGSREAGLGEVAGLRMRR